MASSAVAKLNGIDLQTYLRHVLTHIGEHPIIPSTNCCWATSLLETAPRQINY
jgi:hypothetical protein